MGPRNHEIFFPDMFIEHVWEITPTGKVGSKKIAHQTQKIKRGRSKKKTAGTERGRIMGPSFLYNLPLAHS